jgi:protein-disulfide isomerase
MNRAIRTGLLPALLIVLTACGATGTVAPQAVAPGRTTVNGVLAPDGDPPPAIGTPGEPIPTPTAMVEQNTGPVTAIMQTLELTGEQYAAEGDPDAPITVIEFSDYGCPFCRRYVGTTYPIIKQEYIDTGKIYYVFKDFPIAQLHPQAHIASEAAECSGEQGKYWVMHDTLFSAPSEWDTTEATAREVFAVYAERIGLDTPRFDDCMAQGRYRAGISSNMAEGRRMGVTGTPTFIVNGKLLVGAQTAEVFQRVLDREIKQQP